MQTPPAGALTCPSSEVPVPKAITGTLCLAQIRTTSWMSAVSCAITTASGGCGASQVVVCACWSRTACDVISRLPNRAASDSMVLASACGSGRFRLLVVVVLKAISSRQKYRGKGYIRGQGTMGSWPRSWLQHTGIDDDDACPGWRLASRAGAVPVVGDAYRAAMDRL